MMRGITNYAKLVFGNFPAEFIREISAVLG